MSPAPATPEAMRKSLTDRIKRQAQLTGAVFPELRQQVLLQRFLARVFAKPDGPWVLKGGSSLLVRLPGARYSRDIDLLHTGADVSTAVAELQDLVNRDPGDHFTFNVVPGSRLRGPVEGTQLQVEASLGKTIYGRFPIDLATELHAVGRFDRARPASLVEVPGLPELPEFTLYPLPDQVSDKVCAMYERHGEQQIPSTRYRDLVDLLLITKSFPLDAALTRRAMDAETWRRGIVLPLTMGAPGPDWTRSYPQVARKTNLGSDLCDLQAALAQTGVCLNPLLSREVTTGTWNPELGVWMSAGDQGKPQEKGQSCGK